MWKYLHKIDTFELIPSKWIIWSNIIIYINTCVHDKCKLLEGRNSFTSERAPSLSLWLKPDSEKLPAGEESQQILTKLKLMETFLSADSILMFKICKLKGYLLPIGSVTSCRVVSGDWVEPPHCILPATDGQQARVLALRQEEELGLLRNISLLCKCFPHLTRKLRYVRSCSV